MNAFAMGFGAVPPLAMAAWLAALAARAPGPSRPAFLATVLAITSAIMFASISLGVRGALLAVRNRDLRAEFRAADPRGWRSAAAGVLSGVVGLGVLVGAVTLGGPGENERDVAMFRFFALGLGSMAAAPFVGVIIFLRVFRPRPAPPG